MASNHQEKASTDPKIENKESVLARKDVEENNLEVFSSIEDWWENLNQTENSSEI